MQNVYYQSLLLIKVTIDPAAGQMDVWLLVWQPDE